jgi:hypothetical protein
MRAPITRTASGSSVILLGRGLRNESLEQLDGLCFWRTDDGQGIDLETLVLTSLAGPAADQLFFGIEPNRNGGDYRDAYAVAQEIADAEGGDVDVIIESARQAAEELVARHAPVIELLADELLGARWREMDGQQVENFLEKNGVPRANVRGGTSGHPADVSLHQRGPQLGYERRGGLTLPAANPDPLRVTATYERRTDGCFV